VQVTAATAVNASADNLPAEAAGKPRLVFFHSTLSGSCRRAEGFLAQVLQRRRNHETFKLYKVAQEERPDLLERFGIETVPTLVVVENKHVRAKLEKPRGCRDIEAFLQPWLH
jgi:thioredoxin-like negative regulator of GroEL